MPQLVVGGQTRSNQAGLDTGIRDLMVREGPGGPVLYALSGPGGGIAAYGIAADGRLTLIDTERFPTAFGPDLLAQLSLIETATGPRLTVAATDSGTMISYALDAQGRIGAIGDMTGLVSAGGPVRDIAQWGGDMLFVANAGAGSVQGYGFGSGPALTPRLAVADTATTYADSVFALETVTVGGTDYLVGASVTDQGVTAYRIDAAGLTATGSLGTDQGLGIMTPTALATAMVGGNCFILLGSAPADGIGQSGTITVMRLREDGELVATDHVMDTLATRFGRLQSLDVAQANGFTYVIAGGGDDGLSVFLLMPNGRLQLVDVMADGPASGLENVTAIATFAGADDLHLFVASEISAGVTELRLDTSRNGSAFLAAAAGGTLTGSALDDIMLGGAGNDRLTGSFGDDTLEDGGGNDTLTGGEGRDTFILRADGRPDTITDFDRARDRLDLSDWPFLYDPGQLTVTPTATGATVTWRGETLVIQTADGTSLSKAQVVATVTEAPQRSPVALPAAPAMNLDRTLTGTGGADLLTGGNGDDLILGGAGNDTLRGGAGDDTLNGGHPDSLSNDDGADRFEGGAGSDWVSYAGSFGSLRIDLQFPQVNTFAARGDTYDSIENVIGSQGPDNIRGTIGGANILMGERGVDYLYGRSGDDSLFGGIGDDVLFGGAGADLLDGGPNRDRAQYSESPAGVLVDLLQPWLNTGEAAGDTYASIEDIAGSEHADTIWGDAGNNRLFGRGGADTLMGRAGDDVLNGGALADWLDGGPGNDTLRGGTHADTFVFNGGQDVIEDFSLSQRDIIAIDDAAVRAVAGMTGPQVVAGFASVVNGRVVFDFGAEGRITVMSLSSLVGLDDEVRVI